MTNSPCALALTQIDTKDWKHWTGLPDCTLNDIKNHYPSLGDDHGQAKIGQPPTLAQFRMAAIPNYQHPIKVWSRDEQTILIELEYPNIESAARYFDKLWGDPEAKLDYYQRTILYQQSAYVYPDRGVAILYNPDRSAVIRIYLFAKTTLADYQKYLHTLPKPRGDCPNDSTHLCFAEKICCRPSTSDTKYSVRRSRETAPSCMSVPVPNVDGSRRRFDSRSRCKSNLETNTVGSEHKQTRCPPVGRDICRIGAAESLAHCPRRGIGTRTRRDGYLSFVLSPVREKSIVKSS